MGSVDVAAGDVGFVVDTVTSVVLLFRPESPQPHRQMVANISSPIVKNCERRTIPVLAERRHSSNHEGAPNASGWGAAMGAGALPGPLGRQNGETV